MRKVEHTRDTLPPLTDAQKAELKRLAARPDTEIDTSDHSELTDAQLAELNAGLLPEEIAALEAEAGPIDGVIAGHCGLSFIEEVDGKIWVNAGVIGMPSNDGTPDVRICVLEEIPFIHELAYDAHAAAADMVGRATPYADALETGVWPSEDALPPHLRRAVAAE